MGDWWRDTLDPKGLSQGDVVSDVAFCMLSLPTQPLKWTQFRGNREGWAHIDTPELRAGRKYFLSHGDNLPAIVISHSCEIDKQAADGRVIVAPVLSLEALEPAMQQIVQEQKHLACMPLPNVPGLGTRYADLRLMSAVPRPLLLDSSRLASMADSGLERLYAQVFKFFMRRDMLAK